MNRNRLLAEFTTLQLCDGSNGENGPSRNEVYVLERPGDPCWPGWCSVRRFQRPKRSRSGTASLQPFQVAEVQSIHHVLARAAELLWREPPPEFDVAIGKGQIAALVVPIRGQR